MLWSEKLSRKSRLLFPVLFEPPIAQVSFFLEVDRLECTLANSFNESKLEFVNCKKVIMINDFAFISIHCPC